MEQCSSLARRAPSRGQEEGENRESPSLSVMTTSPRVEPYAAAFHGNVAEQKCLGASRECSRKKRGNVQA